MRLGILERISQNRLAQTRLSSSSELFPALPLSFRRGGWGVRLEGAGGVRLPKQILL